MNISISNIAWDKEDDIRVYKLLKKYRVTGLDVAPTRVFDKPLDISNNDGQKFISEIAEYGIHPVGMQSLLFGTEGLELFGNDGIREATIVYLKKMMDYASKIGITRLVFGSPKNRLIGNKPKQFIQKEAYRLFSDLGEYAMKKKVLFCIEPNPIVYGADFITNTMEGIELVKTVNHPGFRLHMDLGTMIINNEDINAVVKEGIEVTSHIHISHPNLEQVIGYEDVHHRFYKALEKNNYSGTVAIEMKKSNGENNMSKIEESIRFISSIYGGRD